jgi:SRSO17 transposase
LQCDAEEKRFQAYLEGLAQVLGHADRTQPMQSYTQGLLLPLERKSVEPMAACLAPSHVRQTHQSLHHFVAESAWSDQALLAQVRRQVLPALTRRWKLAAWIVDDTGFPKKGTHSVGVQRQYCGQLGKQENCRVAVSVSLATAEGSLPAAYRLYLPESWTKDRERCRRVGVPENVSFRSKPEIALEQIRTLVQECVPRAVVLADAAYGNDNGFREGLESLHLRYAVGIQSTTTVWAPGTGPLAVRPKCRRGRIPSRLRREVRHQPQSVKELAQGLKEKDFRVLSWREGERGPMRSRFAAVRVRVAHRDYERSQLRPPQWLLIEWPKGEKEPTRYWLSNLPKAISRRRLVATAKLCWRVERDYEELKQELGLRDYEGRNWRGFHHHATLSIAAYGFLLLEQCLFPPPSKPKQARERFRFQVSALSSGYIPRGGSAARGTT